jgi:hypothetical protein
MKQVRNKPNVLLYKNWKKNEKVFLLNLIAYKLYKF